MANAYSFDPATGQVKQATQGLEAKIIYVELPRRN
ncbi:hypothetical protein BANRA_01693 [Acinetobacter baumannii]|nr:hypothetical protein BANRA_01693 [Acinetobacter baumannii]